MTQPSDPDSHTSSDDLFGDDGASPSIIEEAPIPADHLSETELVNSIFGPEAALMAAMHAGKFPSAVLQYLVETQGLDGSLVQGELAKKYLMARPRIRGAPPIEQLQLTHGPAIMRFHLAAEHDWTWDELVASAADEYQRLSEERNPFLPNWVCKDETKPNLWIKTVPALQADEDSKEKLNKIFREATDSQEFAEILKSGPCTDLTFMDELLTALMVYSPMLAKSIGRPESSKDTEFRCSIPLCVVGSLGLDALRFFAEKHAATDPDWEHYLTCSDDELLESVFTAQRICGYPLAILRVDGRRLLRAMDEIGLTRTDWLDAVVLTHLFKYVRFLPSYALSASEAGPALTVQYRGVQSVFQLNPAGLHQGFSDSVNSGVAISICRHLGIPYSTRASQRGVGQIIPAILRKIKPIAFAHQRPLQREPDLLVPPVISFEMAPTDYSYPWVRTETLVPHCYRVDLETGTVKPEHVTGTNALALAFPVGIPKPEMIARWHANMPPTIKPCRPSEIFFKHIRNIHDFGYPAAMRAIFDAMILGNHGRTELAGSPVGSAMVNEFPPLLFMPVEGSKEGSTNQGKSLAMRLAGAAMVPGLRGVIFNRSSSAPVQRAMQHELLLFGTALFDEFQLPDDPSHFLSASGLQGFCTGSPVSAGLAGGNATPIEPKNSICCSVKVASFPPDIYNRMFAIYMKRLSDEYRCNEDEMAYLDSGAASTEMRIGAMLYAKKTKLFERLKSRSCVSAKLHRMRGFATIALELMGNTAEAAEQIGAYFKACMQHATKQSLEANESGLADQVGVGAAFSAAWYFEQCSDETLETIVTRMMTLKADTPDAALVTMIVEDGKLRRMSAVSASCRILERTIVGLFREAATAGHLKRPGWQLVMSADGPRGSHLELVKLSEEATETIADAPTAEELNKQLKLKKV